jgi:hypothetical protein
LAAKQVAMNCADIILPWIKVSMKKKKLNKLFAGTFPGKAKSEEDQKLQ